MATTTTRLFSQVRARQLLPLNNESDDGARGFFVYSHGLTTGTTTSLTFDDRYPHIFSTTQTCGDLFFYYRSAHAGVTHADLHTKDLPVYFDYMLKNLIMRNNGNLGCYVKPYFLRFNESGNEDTAVSAFAHIQGAMGRNGWINTVGMYSLGIENNEEINAGFNIEKGEPFLLLPSQTIQIKRFHKMFSKKQYTSDYLFHENSADYNSLCAEYICLEIIGLPVHKTGNIVGTATDVGYGYWTIDCIEESVCKIRIPELAGVSSSVVGTQHETLVNIPLAEQEFLPSVNPQPVLFQN